jgi:3-oxoacyl-[acyl-carrier protein] reductase
VKIPAPVTTTVLPASDVNMATFAADTSEPESCQAMAAAALKRYGSIDILCTNAGIFPAAKLSEMTATDFDQVIGTNLKGTFFSVSAVLPSMKAKKKGRIVITSSFTGPITGYPGWSHYGASKADQLGFMRTAAVELAPSGNIFTEGLEGLGEDYLTSMAAASR